MFSKRLDLWSAVNILGLVVIMSLNGADGMLVGGLSEMKLPTAGVTELAHSIRKDAQEQIGEDFPEFTLVGFSTQVVAGTNYFMKIKVSDSEYIHVRVFAPLPHTGLAPSFKSWQRHKQLDDPIVHF